MYYEELFSSKKNEDMKYAGKWMNVKIIILREITCTQIDRYYVVSFLCES